MLGRQRRAFLPKSADLARSRERESYAAFSGQATLRWDTAGRAQQRNHSIQKEMPTGGKTSRKSPDLRPTAPRAGSGISWNAAKIPSICRVGSRLRGFQGLLAIET